MSVATVARVISSARGSEDPNEIDDRTLIWPT